MIKLVKKEKLEGIWAGDMKDGNVGVIVAHPNSGCGYLGKVVQRYDDDLIVIGMSHGNGWGSIFNACLLSKGFRVRLLEKGEMLVVT